MGNDLSRDAIKDLQLEMLRIQQGVWRNKERIIILFEGMDAAGKGGAIKRITEVLDPRSVKVHPVGPPTPEEQGKHWLYRFWLNLPSPGMIAIFDRSWYGRVLVERVDKLTPGKDWKRAYSEINQFEQMLVNDGIHLVKIFLKISKKEQGKRFKARLEDPYKKWKNTEADLKARKQWDKYEKAIADMVSKTKVIPWHIVEADDKEYARIRVLEITSKNLKKMISTNYK